MHAVETTFQSRDPFVPARVHRGFVAEFRDREEPDDAMEQAFEPAQFSTDRAIAVAAAEEGAEIGWETRVLPGVAEQHRDGNFTLHRLH